MPCSEARRLANQRNAQKSTGPKTEAGKLAARMNSLTHGMRSEHGLVPPHLAEAVAKHQTMLADHYRPAPGHQTWLLEQVADAAARLDYCQFMIRAEIDNIADRADLCWHEDRTLAAEETASRLPKDPSRTAARLRETPQGCRWLLARWDALSVPLMLEIQGWNEDQCNLAANLMGVGPDLRASYPALEPTADPSDQKELTFKHIDDINYLLDALEPLDAKQRSLAQMGYPLRPSKELLRFERYEARQRKVYTEAMREFLNALSLPVHAPEPLTALEDPPLVEPPIVAPIQPGPAPGPQDNLKAAPQPEFQGGQSIVSLLTEAVDSFQARQARTEPDPAPLPPSTPGRPTPPLSRRARRELEKAARKRKRKSHAG